MHMKYSKLLDQAMMYEVERIQGIELYWEFYNCRKCYGGGDLNDALDYHIAHCIEPVSKLKKDK